MRVPEDLDAVTRVDISASTGEVDPSEAEMSRRGVDAIWKAVQGVYETGLHPGVFFCLRRRGKVVINRAIGHARGNGPKDPDGAETVPATPDTPVCLFSASNAVLAMAVHHLSETGAVNLLDPVSHYIPEFAAGGKESITLHGILTHRSGVPAMPQGVDPAILLDREKCLSLICRNAPFHPGGRHTAYRFLTGGFILGEILTRVTGMSLRDYVAENIAGPLGMRFFNYGLAPEDQDLAAFNHRTGQPAAFPFSLYAKRILRARWDRLVNLSNSPAFMDAVIPSVNFFATAREMAAFFQLLANQGELDGVRVFSPLTVRRALTVSTAMELDRTLLLPMRYTAGGFMMGASPVGIFGTYSRNCTGYWGFSSHLCWSDPGRDISVSLLTTGKPIVGPLTTAMARLLFSLSWNCRGKGHDMVSMAKPFQLGKGEAAAMAKKSRGLAYNPDRISEFSEKVLLSLVHEGERRMRKSVYTLSGQTPGDIIHEDGLLTVKHYHPLAEDEITVQGMTVPVEKKRHRMPLVFIPPLMAPGFAFDLYPERSLVRYYLARGFDVYLVDFGKPGREHARVSFEHYILVWMADALAAVRKDAGRKGLSLWGYCMGGLFCLLYTAVLHDQNVKNIVTVASPVDTHQMGAAGKIFSLVGLPARKLEKALGVGIADLDPRLLHIPGILGTIGFNLTNPIGVVKSQVDLLVNLWDRKYLTGHDTLSQWINNLLDYPGSTLQDILVQIFLANSLGRKGSMTIGEKEASLSDIRCPIMAFAGTGDKIVPERSARMILDRVGSKEKEFALTPGGHIGVIIGSAAPAQLWKQSADWLGERSL